MQENRRNVLIKQELLENSHLILGVLVVIFGIVCLNKPEKHPALVPIFFVGAALIFLNNTIYESGRLGRGRKDFTKLIKNILIMLALLAIGGFSSVVLL